MKFLKWFLTLLLGFIVGIVGTVGSVIFGGYYAVNNITANDAQEIVQNFKPDFALPKNLPTELLDKTILELFNEAKDIASNLDKISLKDLEKRIGYKLPTKIGGRDLTNFLKPIMEVPIKSIPGNLNLLVNNINVGNLVNLGIIKQDALPNIPMFQDPEMKNKPLLTMISDLNNLKVCDVMTLYTGDYYPGDTATYKMETGDIVSYDSTNENHKNLTRYNYTFVADDNGEFIYKDNQYIPYDSQIMKDEERFSKKLVPYFLGAYVYENATFVEASPEDTCQKYFKSHRSPEVLIAIGSSHLTEVPEGSNGKSISQTIRTLQIKDIINITEDSTPVIQAIKNAYLGNVAPEGGKNINDTIETLQIKDILNIYLEDEVDESGNIIHNKSNQVLIALKDAYIGKNAPEGGKNINDTINSLQVGSIIDINQTLVVSPVGEIVKKPSAKILIAIKNAYLGKNAPEGEQSITSILNTLKIEDIIDITETEKYVYNQNGNLVIETFADYDENNIEHQNKPRFNNVSGVMEQQADGAYVALFANYSPELHPNKARFSLQSVSNKVLVAIKEAYIGNTPPEGGKTISQTVDTLTLSSIIEINEESQPLLKKLKDCTIKELKTKITELKLKDAIEINTENIYNEQGQIVKFKTNKILISLQEAYIGKPPVTDPEGKSISDMISDKVLSDFIPIYNGDEYGYNENGTYAKKPNTYALYNELTYNNEKRYQKSTKDYGFYPNVNGDYILVTVGEYIEINDENKDELESLPKFNKLNKSSNFLINLADSHINQIDNKVNNLALGEVINITDSSPKVLHSLKGTKICNLNSAMATLNLDDVINIYDGYEYVLKDDGEFVINGYELYYADNPTHKHLIRYMTNNGKYIENPNGSFVKKFESYDENNPNHIDKERYTHPIESTKLLQVLQNKSILTIDKEINKLQLKNVLDINDDSPLILKALQDTYIGNDVPELGISINDKITNLRLHDVIDIKENDTYVENENGSFVLINDVYVLYDETIHNGQTRYELIPKSSFILQNFKNVSINNLNEKLSNLTLKEVQPIYTGYEYYEKADGNFVDDGFVEYDSTNNYHKVAQRYKYNGVGYIEDNEGLYVKSYREKTDSDVAPFYSLREKSSNFLISLKDKNINQLDQAFNELNLSDIIEINNSSPKILQFLANKNIQNLDSSLNELTLSDVIEVVDYQDTFINDNNGLFVNYNNHYVLYDSTNANHNSLQRLTRQINVTSNDDVYQIADDGAYVYDKDNNNYIDYNETNHAGMLRYNKIAKNSSPLILALKDSTIYGTENSFSDKVNNLTLIDVLGTPTEGTLIYELSYNGDTPVKINEIEAHIPIVLYNAKMEDLDKWGIISKEGIDAALWLNIYDKTIQETLVYISANIPSIP